MTKQHASLPHWPVPVGDLPATGRSLDIDATEAERRMIADAYSVRDIAVFQAQMELRPYRGSGVHLSGRLKVRLTQSCVVSLRPVEELIDEAFERRFLPAESLELPAEVPPGGRKGKAELIVGLDEEEPPEPLTGATIDVADVLLEEFALALNPYPRHPDAVLEGASEDGEGSREEGPFAVLKGRRSGKSE